MDQLQFEVIKQSQLTKVRSALRTYGIGFRGMILQLRYATEAVPCHRRFWVLSALALPLKTDVVVRGLH